MSLSSSITSSSISFRPKPATQPRRRDPESEDEELLRQLAPKRPKVAATTSSSSAASTPTPALTDEKLLTQLHDHQFNCPACLQIFVDPVSCPMGHSFCLTCTNKIPLIDDGGENQGEQQCPTCRRFVTYWTPNLMVRQTIELLWPGELALRKETIWLSEPYGEKLLENIRRHVDPKMEVLVSTGSYNVCLPEMVQLVLEAKRQHKSNNFSVPPRDWCKAIYAAAKRIFKQPQLNLAVSIVPEHCLLFSLTDKPCPLRNYFPTNREVFVVRFVGYIWSIVEAPRVIDSLQDDE